MIQIAPEPRADGKLVTSGIYRWLRRPIYTSIVLIVIGLWLRKPTIVLGIVAAVVLGFLIINTRYEEQLLAARYPEHPAYRSRSFGLLPPFRG